MMKIRNFKAAAAILALSAGISSGAYAASSDGAQGTFGLGTGIGDLILSIRALGTPNSINWDLSNGANDLTVNDIIAAAASSGGSFTISNPTVTAFVTANANIGWTLMGLSNRPSDKFGIVAPNDAPAADFSALGNNNLLGQIMQGAALWVGANNTAGIPDNGTLTSTSTAQPFNFQSTNLTSGSRGAAGQSFGVNPKDDLVNLFFIHAGTDIDFDDPGSSSPLADLLGTLELKSNGDLVFTSATAVPVPAAVWLLGSALGGMATIRRRKA